MNANEKIYLLSVYEVLLYITYNLPDNLNRLFPTEISLTGIAIQGMDK